MSFRRRKPDPKRTAAERARIDRHWPTLKAIGLPPVVCRDYAHWDDFLENGCLDFHLDTTRFAFTDLSEEQLVQLRSFLEEHYGRQDRTPPLLEWLRYRQDQAKEQMEAGRPGGRHPV